MGNVREEFEKLADYFRRMRDNAEKAREEAEQQGQGNRLAHEDQKMWDYDNAYNCLQGAISRCLKDLDTKQ